MEAVCTVAMILMALCSPIQEPLGPTPDDPIVFTRVNPSSSILGRQLAVGPVTPAMSHQNFPPSFPWGNPRRLAYCGADGIKSSLDGGQTWRHIPTAGVEALAEQTDLPIAPRRESTPGCQSVTLDPSKADSFYAVFAALKRPQDAPPPWIAVGYVTRDAGQTWQPVPVPEGAPDAPFGGFSTDTGAVEALFSPPQAPGSPRPRSDFEAANDPEAVAPPLVMLTTDGGQTWKGAGFGCPARGNCVRFGPAPTAIGSCAMHGYAQPLLVSPDLGQTWQTPLGASGVNACRPNELVEIADKDVLLMSPGGSEVDPDAAPVRRSHDGGKTFEPLALPESPGGPSPNDLFELYVLPDERLLARVSGQTPGPGWHWQLLGHNDQPGTVAQSSEDTWCTVASSAGLPQTGTPLRVAGSRLWWLADDGLPVSLSIPNLQCADASTAPPESPASTPTPPR